MMKIVSWNVNGLRSVLGQTAKKTDPPKENKLFKFIETVQPDALCLQEIKAFEEQINPDLRAPEGYTAYYNSCQVKAGYSGTAVFTKIEPKENSCGIGIPEFDGEGRIQRLLYPDFALYNIYFPNGSRGMERVDYKLRFYDSLFKSIEEDRKSGINAVVCGDFNTARTELDLANPKSNEKTSGFLPIEREKLEEIFSLGYVDAFRIFNHEGGQYTWWDARFKSRERNAGWRIDYFLVDKDLAPRVVSCSHLTEVYGSDHCPIMLIIE